MASGLKSEAPKDTKADTQHIEDIPLDATVTNDPKGEARFEQLKSRYDTLTVPQAVRVFWKACIICLFAAFAATPDGYQINLNGGIIANKGFILQFHGNTYVKGVPALLAAWVSAWGGMQSVGQIIGMLSLPPVSDRWGRRVAFAVIWVVLVASVLAETLARTWWAWLIAKILAGAGVGMLQATMPPYITEIAPAQLKGLLVNSYSMFFTLGQFFASLALQRMNRKNPLNYLVPIYTQWAMIGMMAFMLAALPESPWWLARKGKLDQGRKALAFINGGIPGYDVDEEFDVLLSVMAEERRAVAAVRQDLKDQPWWIILKGTDGYRTFLSASAKCTQQLTGLTMVNSYATYFFQLAGNSDPFRVTVILACVQIATVLVVMALSDGIGRRDITVYGFYVTSLSCLAIGIIGCFNYASKALGSLLIFFACLAISSNTGAGAIGYIYSSELATQTLKSRTSGFAVACGAVFGVVFSTSVPSMLAVTGAGWGVKTGFFFAATGFIASTVLFLFLPECARRSPAEIDEMFAAKISTRKFKGYETEVQRELRREIEAGEVTLPA